MADVTCKDCLRDGVTTPRPTPHGGPRSPLCVTHHRARCKASKAAAHGRRLEKTYRISADVYWALHAWQGGRCYGCGKATGATKNLAVDHDHELAKLHDHAVDEACIACIRCICCSVCNAILGRYDIAALCRLIEILGPNPPARVFFAQPGQS